MTIQSQHKGHSRANNLWAQLELFVVVTVIAIVLTWQYSGDSTSEAASGCSPCWCRSISSSATASSPARRPISSESSARSISVTCPAYAAGFKPRTFVLALLGSGAITLRPAHVGIVRMLVQRSVLAPLRHPPMSALRPRLGVKRTQRRRRLWAVHDPSRTSARGGGRSVRASSAS
jgi:hypothetical protein